MNMGDLAGAEFVIFEGADGVGKTTLATACCAEWGWAMWHHDYLPQHSRDIFVRYRDELSNSRNVAMDRSYVSELVYGPVVRGGSRLSPAQRDELTDIIRARGGVLVHVHASVEQIESRLRQREGTPPSRGRIEQIVEKYETVFIERSARVRVLRWDTTD
jgi:thymidylate kinase